MKKIRKLTLGNLIIDRHKHQVSNQNKEIPLRKKEFELLEFMARNKNRVINRLTILEYVWNYRANTDTNTLEVHIAGLRRKLRKYNAHKLIKTVHGLGYILNDVNENVT